MIPRQFVLDCRGIKSFSIIRLLFEIGCEFIVVVVSVVFFRRLNIAYKLVALHAVLAFSVEVAGKVLHVYGRPNIWPFNCFVLADFGLMLLAGYNLAPHVIDRRILWLGYVLWVPVWIGQLWSLGIGQYLMITYIVYFTIVLVVFLRYLYDAVLSFRGQRIFRLHLVWLYLGVILFYGCNIPFFSMFDAFMHCPMPVKKTLFNILKILNNIRYGSTAVAMALYAHSSGSLKTDDATNRYSY